MLVNTVPTVKISDSTFINNNSDKSYIASIIEGNTLEIKNTNIE